MVVFGVWAHPKATAAYCCKHRKRPGTLECRQNSRVEIEDRARGSFDDAFGRPVSLSRQVSFAHLSVVCR